MRSAGRFSECCLVERRQHGYGEDRSRVAPSLDPRPVPPRPALTFDRRRNPTSNPRHELRRRGHRQLAVDGCCPLGVEPEEIRSTFDRLAPGELLAMFTDGLTELSNASDEMLGMIGLGEGLRLIYAAGHGHPVTELVDQLNTCLDRYEGGGIANDDRTFLLARLRGG